MSFSLQLPLSVQVRDDVTFDGFYGGRNTSLLNMLDVERISKHDELEPFIYMYGDHGVGKSHLLQSACQQASKLCQSSIYLPMNELVHSHPRMLEGMSSLDLICIDDMNAIAGIYRWEEAIFDLFNQLRDSNKRLLVASSKAPRNLDIQLLDLVSRLSWGVVFSIYTLTDDEKIHALKMRAHLRGMDLTDDVARFIIHRNSRDMSKLFSVLARLDGASLRAKRKLSIPFVKEVMNW